MFFSRLPDPAEPERTAVPAAPAWVQPPDELGVPIVFTAFLERTTDTVLAVTGITAYSNGCAITAKWALRRGTRSDEGWRAAVTSGTGHHAPFEAPGDVALRFGTIADDGGIARSDGNVPWWTSAADEPFTGPSLIVRGGASGGSDDRFDGTVELWLWPLPADGVLELVAEWQGAGMPERRIRFDATAIRTAALGSLPFFDDEAGDA
ncbi:hypothetical protein ACFCVO_02875 [Agromyces sp. NPDC056379]|uniref:hypothetical protein n=1 Tax=unclassified Agromyces TaxID=2639701 RepID=UPI0035DE60F7